jgi:hypothetical protein
METMTSGTVKQNPSYRNELLDRKVNNPCTVDEVI